MNTTAPRDMTWQEICGGLSGTRESVYSWLLHHGPATTTQIMEGTKIGLLTVRPRVSELCAWGFAECVGREHREGIYRARTILEAQAIHEESRLERQLNLKLN